MSKVAQMVDVSGLPTPAEAERFIREAFKVARKPGYRGIHTVYSGLNDAIRRHFNCDAVALTQSLEKAGKIITHPAKGGAMLYLPEEPPITKSGGETLLKKMGKL